MKIIAITGLIGSGKDTAADYLCTNKGFKRMSYAEPLKDAISTIFGWDRELLEVKTKHSREWREQIDPWWAERLQITHLTPRWVLQHWGTEVCRRGFHDDIWIASIENKLRNIKEDVVISDCRFPNEIASIRKLGGIALRVFRGPEPEWYPWAGIVTKGQNNPEYKKARKKLDQSGIHASEYSSVGLNYDFTIDNNGTIDDLYRQIDSIINQ